MGGKREKPKDIVLKLRQIEVLHGQGMPVADAVRQVGITQQSYYRWCRQYGGMSRSQLKRLKELEKENQRLRRAVSDLTLDKLILAEAARGNCLKPLAPPPVHRPCAVGTGRVRAPRLPHAGPAPLHAESPSSLPAGTASAVGSHPDLQVQRIGQPDSGCCADRPFANLVDHAPFYNAMCCFRL
ncbi:transposase-like protein [Limimaricola variabilis]|uniref:Transposase-like protein n=1 Tax=Limimaricola variabilis TaxID=1492771 RepID=A0ABR6HRU1_9RHOB|nr:transposase-like protein [Limimaricola variabilis]